MSPVAGGKCELRIHVGFKARIPWTERANIEVSTAWIQGLSTLAPVAVPRAVVWRHCADVLAGEIGVAIGAPRHPS
jgi:hypothetical protein